MFKLYCIIDMLMHRY